MSHLDEKRMHEAAQHLVGQHDFSSFRAAQCQARTPMRNLQEISVTRHGELVVLTVFANAFLHHMVRNIAGVLIAIGTGERPVDWTAQVLGVQGSEAGRRDRRAGRAVLRGSSVRRGLESAQRAGIHCFGSGPRNLPRRFGTTVSRCTPS